MKWRNWLCPLNWVVFSLSAAIGACTFWAWHHYPVKNSGDVAAWVQALGSLIGLYAVYLAAKTQSDATLNAVHEQQKIINISNLDSAFFLVENAVEIVANESVIVEDYNDSTDGLRLINDQLLMEASSELPLLNEFLKRLESIDLISIKNKEMIKKILYFKNQLNTFIFLKNEFILGTNSNENLVELFKIAEKTGRAKEFYIKSQKNKVSKIIESKDNLISTYESMKVLLTEKP